MQSSWNLPLSPVVRLYPDLSDDQRPLGIQHQISISIFVRHISSQHHKQPCQLSTVSIIIYYTPSFDLSNPVGLVTKIEYQHRGTDQALTVVTEVEGPERDPDYIPGITDIDEAAVRLASTPPFYIDGAY